MKSFSDLHSNMFLLIRIIRRGIYRGCPFTFQYVSINTVLPLALHYPRIYLHSNMFLLILLSIPRKIIREPLFTFQYVSINTFYFAPI